MPTAYLPEQLHLKNTALRGNLIEYLIEGFRRGFRTIFPLLHGDCLHRAPVHAETASDASVIVDLGNALIVHLEGLDLTLVDAYLTT